MQKLTSIELVEAHNALTQVNEGDYSMEIAKTLAINLEELKVPFDIYQKKRNKLLEKFGTKDASGVQFSIPNEKIGEYNSALEKLHEDTVQVDIVQVELKELMAAPGSTIKPNYLIKLKFMFSDYLPLEKSKAEVADIKDAKK